MGELTDIMWASLLWANFSTISTNHGPLMKKTEKKKVLAIEHGENNSLKQTKL